MRKNTIFNQIMQLLSRQEFRKIVEKHNGDKYTKKIDCWQQLMILLYMQIKDLKSLREIETSLKSHTNKWHILGLESVARSTLSDANTYRSSEIFEDVFYSFLAKCHSVAPFHNFNISMPVFSHDATLIPLCLSVFPWARYRRRKGALKLHMLLDHEGCLPSFVRMTSGKIHEINVVRDKKYGFPDLPSDSILTVDRGYIDYSWLYSMHKKGVQFIIRTKKNMAYRIVGQHQAPNKKRKIISDDVIEFTNFYEKQKYPEYLRLIRYWYMDKHGNKQEIEVITNNFLYAASTLAGLYKGRWDIETFFKWIKEHLKIKTFIGTSPNAVMTQVWAAMIVYLMLSFIKFQTRFKASLSELFCIIREVLLENKSIIEYLRLNWDKFVEIRGSPLQLSLF